MTEPSQYAKNGICRFENFPGCLINLTEIELGTTDVENYLIKWYMGLQIIPDPEGDRLRAYLNNKGVPDYAQISFRALFKISKNDKTLKSRGKHTNAANKKVFSGHSQKISEIVNNPFEWLKNGALEIEYGINVEAHHKFHGIWKFIFGEKIFDWNNDFDKITLVSTNFIKTKKGDEFYCNKELLNFHSQYFSSIFSFHDQSQKLPLIIDFETHDLEVLLQLAHGVHVDCFITVPIAEKLNLRNVSRYCERRMIECQDKTLRGFFLSTAIEYDLNHFVAHYLKTRKSLKKIKERDIQHMSRNTMMLILANVMKDSF
ncbi:unnamed protein product [Caenorhabditis nigoni]